LLLAGAFIYYRRRRNSSQSPSGDRFDTPETATNNPIYERSNAKHENPMYDANPHLSNNRMPPPRLSNERNNYV